MSFLEIASAQLRVAISPYGAALARLWFNNRSQSLVLGLAKPEDYGTEAAYMGVTVGPIAGRIAGAQVRLDNKTYQMHANTSPDCLHSGDDGVHQKKWLVVEHTKDRLTLGTHLMPGDCGLPGNRAMTVTYQVDDAQMTITITTRSDADTYVNAANHAYWSLDGKGDLTAHRLQVYADSYVETGFDLIPTGVLAPMRGSDRDFSLPRCPVDGPPLDGTFVLSRTHALTLASSESGVQMDVATNQPGVVLYTAQHMPHLPAPAQTPSIGPFSGIAVETQALPDAPNHSHFPSILLRSGEEMHQTTTYTFSDLPA